MLSFVLIFYFDFFCFVFYTFFYFSYHSFPTSNLIFLQHFNSFSSGIFTYKNQPQIKLPCYFSIPKPIFFSKINKQIIKHQSFCAWPWNIITKKTKPMFTLILCLFPFNISIVFQSLLWNNHHLAVGCFSCCSHILWINNFLLSVDKIMLFYTMASSKRFNGIPVKSFMILLIDLHQQQQQTLDRFLIISSTCKQNITKKKNSLLYMMNKKSVLQYRSWVTLDTTNQTNDPRR